jgi:hypothetical protein
MRWGKLRGCDENEGKVYMFAPAFVFLRNGVRRGEGLEIVMWGLVGE